MTKLFSPYISDLQFTDQGISFWVSEAEPVTVHGAPMARLSSGVIVPADGWKSSKTEAMRSAAHRIEVLGMRLLEQARSIRAKADAEVTNATS